MYTAWVPSPGRMEGRKEGKKGRREGKKEGGRKEGKLNDLNSTSNPFVLTEINRLHSTMAKYIFLSSSHGTLTKPDQVSGHKTHLQKFKNK
jgi:hypothetical protein